MLKREYENLQKLLKKRESDWVEERNGKLFGFEFKWNNKKAKVPTQWVATYANASFEVINQDNFLEFIK